MISWWFDPSSGWFPDSPADFQHRHGASRVQDQQPHTFLARPWETSRLSPDRPTFVQRCGRRIFGSQLQTGPTPQRSRDTSATNSCDSGWAPWWLWWLDVSGRIRSGSVLDRSLFSAPLRVFCATGGRFEDWIVMAQNVPWHVMVC